MTHHSLQVVVVTGGLGTRMHAVSTSLPKHLLPVAHTPILGWTLTGITRLASAVSTQVIVSSDNHGECIADWIAEYGYNAEIHTQERRNGWWNAARCILSQMDKSHAALIIVGDTYFDFNLESFINDCIQSEMISVATFSNDINGLYRGVFDVTNQGLSYCERNAAMGEHIGIGVYLAPVRLFCEMLDECESPCEHNLFNVTIGKGLLQPVACVGYARNINDAVDLLDANLAAIARGTCSAKFPKGCPYIHPACHVASSASVVDSVIGRDAVVGEDVQLENCLVLPGTRVVSGTVAKRAVFSAHAFPQLVPC